MICLLKKSLQNHNEENIINEPKLPTEERIRENNVGVWRANILTDMISKPILLFMCCIL
jgi:hypothetical protein